MPDANTEEKDEPFKTNCVKSYRDLPKMYLNQIEWSWHEGWIIAVKLTYMSILWHCCQLHVCRCQLRDEA